MLVGQQHGKTVGEVVTDHRTQVAHTCRDGSTVECSACCPAPYHKLNTVDNISADVSRL